MQIIPTVTEKEWEKAERRLNAVRDMSKWMQIDVIDGTFAEGRSFELELLNSYEFAEKMLWDIHLMVSEPKKWIEKCIFVGASRIIGQVETMSDSDEFIKRVHDEGLEAGVAFDIETKVGKIPTDTDWVLLMGRKAGFGRDDLNERVFDKIGAVRDKGFRVAIDGGVSLENIGKLEEAGVEIVYSGIDFEKIYADRNRNK